MNLSIRTQNKDVLIPYNGLYIDDSDMVDKGYVEIYSGDGRFELGIYKSKERALEVLDEIQKRIAYVESISNFDLSNVNITKIIYPILKENNIDNLSIVYEMPKDDE